MKDQMTREDIIKLAREAGVKDWWDSGNDNAEALLECLERFAALVAAAEREAAEERVTDLFADMETPYLPDIVAAIAKAGEQA